MSDTTQSPIKFTDLARDAVLRFADMGGDSSPAVRIQVSSPSPLDPRYEITLIDDQEKCEEDLVFGQQGFEVVMDPESAKLLDGASVDWVESLQQSGFKVENSNLAPIGSKPLEGPLADRVQQVIEQYVNPGVAQHGGHVTLVEVRDKIVYLQMGGGCQGCGMADVTLKQGVEVMIIDNVPGISEVVDATDHDAGTNPFY